MASPVKAFVDPTGLSRMAGNPTPGLKPTPNTSFRALLPYAGITEWNPCKFGIASGVLGNLSGFRLQVLNAKIPPPPMGRMLLATFPPVYRAQGTYTDGQFYPPPAP